MFRSTQSLQEERTMRGLPLFAILATCLVAIGCSDGSSNPSPGTEQYLYFSRIDGTPRIVRWEPGSPGEADVIVQNATLLSGPRAGRLLGCTTSGSATTLFSTTTTGTDRKDLYVLAGDIVLNHAEFDRSASKILCQMMLSRGSYADGALIVMNADGTGGTHIAGNVAHETGAHFSPVGTTVAYMTRRRYPDVPDSLYVVNVDGSERRLVSTEVAIASNDMDQWMWSPDGASIIYTNFSEENTHLRLLDVASGTTRRLSADSNAQYGGLFSPDGTQIVVTSTTSPTAIDGSTATTITIVNMNGTGRRVICRSDMHELLASPVISADNGYIAYLRIPTGGRPGPDYSQARMEVVRVADGSITRLDGVAMHPYWY
ncbi:MAG: hypothetical protein BGO89_13195 [Candidatus Kapaibacterium thiocyanatum]|uniref:DUF5050 domain-containing protein n=1 Tax=Candidatus Kapaibacterium thiocyanatum TaxID=1895771 RepID=A0A1M3KV78_9BACT|nr:MAG: hypothetical protein BGO89_13195 ['Candidatus Kapabacteria' thiocyanatum]